MYLGPDGDQTRPNPPLLNFAYRELSHDRASVLSGDGEQVETLSGSKM